MKAKEVWGNQVKDDYQQQSPVFDFSNGGFLGFGKEIVFIRGEA